MSLSKFHIYYFSRCLFLVFMLINTGVYSQSNIDSLEKLVNAAQSKQKIKLIYSLARACHDAGQHDKALKYSKQALDIAIQLKDVSHQANFINEFGIYYESKMVLDSALAKYLKAYDLFQSVNNKKGETMLLGNIGNIYRIMRNYGKASEYLNQSLKISKEFGSKDDVANSENGLATYFYDINKLDSSLVYFQSSLQYYLITNEKRHIADMKNNIGSIYNELNKHQEAIENYTQALDLYNELSSQFDVTVCLANIGNVYNMSGNPEKGVDYSLKALNVARTIKAKSLIVPIYVFLIEGSKMLGDFKNVIKYQEELINYKDTVYDSQTNENIAEMQTRFDTEKKESENKLLKQENDLQSLSIKQQKIINYSIMGGLILVVGLAFFIFKGYRQKQKANLLLEEKNELIEEKNKIVEEKQKEIIDSINYAKRIQYTLLAHEYFLTEHLPQHFVLFNPKDIVSGDFYWATKHGNKFYLAVCDSTGHGVPGAFMSLLNIGYLSEAINEKNIERPNEVFNYVRQRLVDTISKEGQKDGFDGILICLDLISKKITYAAANNRPILVRNNELIEQDLDRMPVGISDKLLPFNLFEIDTKPGDCLYLYTDGYADQFGGPKGKKFKYKPLNEMILSNHQSSLSSQREFLQFQFNLWRGNLEQVDDVCMIGMKI